MLIVMLDALESNTYACFSNFMLAVHQIVCEYINSVSPEHKKAVSRRTEGKKPCTASERALLELLLRIPHLSVEYESKMLSGEWHGKPRSTKPDFWITNTHNPRSVQHPVEITISRCARENQGLEDKDPKCQQRAVVKQNGHKLVVLYDRHLRNIQRAHPELDFGLPPELDEEVADTIDTDHDQA